MDFWGNAMGQRGQISERRENRESFGHSGGGGLDIGHRSDHVEQT